MGDKKTILIRRIYGSKKENLDTVKDFVHKMYSINKVINNVKFLYCSGSLKQVSKIVCIL